MLVLDYAPLPDEETSDSCRQRESGTPREISGRAARVGVVRVLGRANYKAHNNKQLQARTGRRGSSLVPSYTECAWVTDASRETRERWRVVGRGCALARLWPTGYSQPFPQLDA